MLVVQFFLVYNTFKLKDEHFFFEEKNVIKGHYSKSIRNDKVFPGAQRIIDKYIYGNMATLEQLYHQDTTQFKIFEQNVCDSIFTELRAKSNMDSLFAAIVTQNKLSHHLQYRLFITALSIVFSDNHYIALYQADTPYPLIDPAIQMPEGIDIDGKLKTPAKQNQVTSLTVSSAEDHSYQLAFALYVDSPDRYLTILKLMMPTFALSIISILGVILIYYSTFKNWLKQKKLAEMKSDFVNSITHEFNTPLATIMIENRNLQKGKIIERKENIQPLTDIIERQSHRLKTLISRVLDVTVMSESTLEKKEYYLNDLLDEILLDYKLKLSESNVAIEFTKDAENHKLLLDKFWFTTMLINIFENAIKYNKSEIKKISVAILKTRKNAEIHITDNGMGMSPQTVRHIFEKFYRSNSNNSDRESGLGLGLYYTKQCVKAHGWQIEVQSSVGVGSKFIIFL